MGTTVSTGRVARAVRRLPHPWVMSKFVLTGALVGGTHLALVTLMVLAGVPIQAALALAYLVALAVHFTLNRQWVFAEHSGYALHFSRQGVRYLLIAGLSYAGTAISVAVLPGLLDIPQLAAFFMAAIAMAGVSFVLLNFWVFRRAEPAT
jgi:putative flippase GtrA